MPGLLEILSMIGKHIVKPKRLGTPERNQADHQAHVEHWAMEKKACGKWLPKIDYEKTTGRPGRK